MSVVLVVEPDTKQAALLRKMQRRLGAELVLVDTTDEAIDAIGLATPDLILLSALLSPRDEDRLIKFLRTLDDATHLHTLTIPQLRTGEQPQAASGGKKGFSFRKKRDTGTQQVGCDPDVFAEEITAQLARAAEVRHRPRVSRARRVTEPQAAESGAEWTLRDPAPGDASASGGVEPPASAAASVDDSWTWRDPGTAAATATFTEPEAMAEPDVFAQPDVFGQPDVFAQPEAFAPPAPEVFAAPELFVQPEAIAQPAIVAEQAVFAQPEVLWQPEPKPVEVIAPPTVIAAEPVIERAIHEPTVSQMLAASWHKLVKHKEPAAPPAVPPPVPRPAPAKVDVDQSELEVLARELGVTLDSGMVEVEEAASAERMAAEVALVHAETAAKLAAELQRVRAEAEERRLAELARLQADADAMRIAAIADARAAAEEETRQALAGEVARVRSEAEGTVAEAINRVKLEAEQTLNQEIGRAREDAEALRADLVRAQQEAAVTARALEANRVKLEAEQTLTQEIGRAREDAEALRADLARAQQDATVTARALEAEVARVRVQAETHLKAELERIGKEAEHARAADQSHAKKTAEQIREAAAREARVIAEQAAKQMLAAEISRVRSQADTVLETELARVRAEAQERQTVELLQLRVQMDAMRQAAAEQAHAAAEQARAAAEHARAAAADQARAAAEHARAAAARRPADVISFPVAESNPDRRVYQEPDPQEYEEEEIEAVEVEDDSRHEEPSSPAPAHGRRDYYSLWRKEPKAAAESHANSDDDEPSQPFNYTRWLKWGLPIAASLLLIGVSGIDTVARLATPAPAEPAPSRVVTSIRDRRAPAAPLEAKFGTLRVESTPAGAQITLDGESRGITPQTISNLKPGAHELVLHSPSGAINRHVSIQAGKTVVASEAIFAGWLAIFAPIKLDVSLNGVATSPTDDGRFMIAPGTYRVNMVNTRFNFHRTETLTVKPGEVTAHTVSLPTGALKIAVPDGTEVTVDGHAIGKAPFSEVLPLVVGTHEVTATHPEFGARRTSVDVKFEETTEAILSFQP
jgi:CheY-like chemotaxis protein